MYSVLECAIMIMGGIVILTMGTLSLNFMCSRAQPSCKLKVGTVGRYVLPNVSGAWHKKISHPRISSI